MGIIYSQDLSQEIYGIMGTQHTDIHRKTEAQQQYPCLRQTLFQYLIPEGRFIVPQLRPTNIQD